MTLALAQSGQLLPLAALNQPSPAPRRHSRSFPTAWSLATAAGILLSAGQAPAAGVDGTWRIDLQRAGGVTVPTYFILKQSIRGVKPYFCTICSSLHLFFPRRGKVSRRVKDIES
jgi:hypothetical protein